MTKVFLIHADGNPTHNAGDNNKSHKVDGNAVNSSSHELSPFHRIANDQGYHETGKIKGKTQGNSKDENFLFQEFAKHKRGPSQVGEVHKFVGEEMTVCFHGANYRYRQLTVSR